MHFTMNISLSKSLLLIVLSYQLQNAQSTEHPLFSNTPDHLDFTGKDYYDEILYPDIKNEKVHYIRGSHGGLSTIKL